MRSWYAFQMSANDAPEATLSIFDEIGFWGVTAKDFIRDLGEVKAGTLNVEINSPGGSVFDGFAIFNALRACGKTINVKVMGVAASIASYIAMAGDKIVMPENTFLMVHQPWTLTMGNADEMREVADTLDKLTNSLVATYMKRTGLSEEEVRNLLSKDTWLSAEEAKELGFADEVAESFAATAKFDPDRLPEHVRAIFASAAPEPTPAPEPAPAPATEPSSPEADEPAPAPATATATAPEPTQAPAEGEPTATPPAAQAQATTFADQVRALAEGAGYAKFAATWAVRHATVQEVEATIAQTREIVALCTLAGRDGDADTLIAAGKTVAEARASLAEALAVADEGRHVDTTPKHNSNDHYSAQPVVVTPDSIWAAYHKTEGVLK